MNIPIALATTVLLNLVGSGVDKARFPKELWDSMFVKGSLSLGVVVGDIIGLVRASHDCKCLFSRGMLL